MNGTEARLRRLLDLPEDEARPLHWQTLQWRDHAVIHVVLEPELLALVIPLGDTGVPDPLEDLVREARAERDSRGLERLQIVLAATRPEAAEDRARALFAAGCRPPSAAHEAEEDTTGSGPIDAAGTETECADPRAALQLVPLDRL